MRFDWSAVVGFGAPRFASLAAMLIMGVLMAVGPAAAAERPNVIFMMLDDLSAVELSCYSTDQHPAGNQTPVIDRAAEQGILFESCWATPLCKPTRSLLMSGKYGYQTGQYGNKLNKEQGPFAKKHRLLPKLMKEAGYATGIVGKWHLPGSILEPDWAWDEYSLLGGYIGPNGPHPWWDGLWFTWKEAANVFHHAGNVGTQAPKYPAMFWNACVIENGEVHASDMNTYGPDVCHDYAMDFIERHQDEPFFLYYPTVLTHDPWFETPDPDRPGVAASRLPAGMASQARYVQVHINDMIKRLKDLGLYENTVIFLTADNATLRYGKGSASEIGVRVPLIVLGGLVKARGRTSALVDYADMLPTIIDIAGVDPSTVEGLDGQSFKPALDDQPGFTGKPYIFSYLDAERTVRTRDYMMDGAGGIWRCSSTGNPQDHQLLPNNEDTAAIRAELLGLIKDYTLPDPADYPHREVKLVDVATNPGVHWATKNYLEMGDDWMNNPRRFEP